MTASTQQVRVLCVDDDPMILRALEKLLSWEQGLLYVGSLNSADQLTATARQLEADVVLLDVTMPGRPPLDAVNELATEFPECRVIVYSGHGDQAMIDAAMDAGASGVVLKDTGFREMVDAIARVASGEVVIPQS